MVAAARVVAERAAARVAAAWAAAARAAAARAEARAAAARAEGSVAEDLREQKIEWVQFELNSEFATCAKGYGRDGRVSCVCGLTATMSDVPPTKDMHVELMAAAKNPWRTAVLYEAWLEHVDESEPLWRVSYFGQIVRVGTPEAIFKVRKRAHETDSAREDKELGFHAVIDMYGPGAIEWRIVSSQSGRRSAMQTLANSEEKRLITAHGGMLRDMDEKLEQTLNLTEGGQGDATVRWASIDASRRRALNKFKTAMEAYVEEYESSLVPSSYVNEEKYKLGLQLLSFRRGTMRRGMPEEAAITAWAEALPKWAWNARVTTEFREQVSQNKKAMWTNASPETKAEWATKKKATNDSKTDEEKAKLLLKRNATLGTDATRAKMSKSAITRRENELPEVKAARDDKMKAKNRTEAFRSKMKKVSTDRMATENREELIRARQLAVPFQRSKKKRAQMRAASTIVGTRKKIVLYMIVGTEIRRVTKSGSFVPKPLGPLVNPPPPDKFDSGSD